MENWIWWGTLCLRIAVATVFGSIVGLERGLRLKDAGIRTHSITACAAALYMILSMYVYGDSPFETDTSILATQIIYGFAFMGAGIIIKDKYQVLAGLRTATGLWVTVAIGMACGQGMYGMAAAATLVVVLVQIIFHRGQLDGKEHTFKKIKLTFVDTPALRAFLEERRQQYGIRAYAVRYKRRGDVTEMTVRVRMEGHLTLEDVLSIYDEQDGILAISI